MIPGGYHTAQQKREGRENDATGPCLFAHGLKKFV